MSCIEEEKTLNYRELQAVAKKLQLPGNLKHHLLLEVVESRKLGNEENVRRILAEQKKERAKRRSEKANGQEAAYRHLQMTRERRPHGRPRKIHLQDPPDKMKLKHRTLPDNYLRSLLAMPSHSIHQLLRESSGPANSSTDLSWDPRLQGGRTPYSNQQILPDNYNSLNYPLDSQGTQESYQTHFMSGCTVKDNQSYLNREFGNRIINSDLPFNNNVLANNNNYGGSYVKGYDSLNNANYLDSRAQDSSRRSFQMRDILSNNQPNLNLVSSQYYSGSEGYNNNNNGAGGEYSLGSGPELEKYNYPRCHQAGAGNSSHNYLGVWDENPSQDLYYWRHFPSPVSSYPNRGVYFDPQGVTSPSSDTLSAPEQEFDSLFSTTSQDFKQDFTFSDFRANNQLSLPLIYSYVASTEGQVCQPVGTEVSDLSGSSLNMTELGCSSSGLLAVPNSQDIQPSTTPPDLFPSDRGVSHERVLRVIHHTEWTSVQPVQSWPPSSHSFVQLDEQLNE